MTVDLERLCPVVQETIRVIGLDIVRSIRDAEDAYYAGDFERLRRIADHISNYSARRDLLERIRKEYCPK